MFHGHGGDTGGISVAGIGWFLYFVFSLVVALFAVKIAQDRRIVRERADKALKNRLKKSLSGNPS